jgi:transcriptional regulator with XRE-family HTH domain
MSALPPPCRALGAELAAAREARGLSEEAMAARLMLSKRQLVSLEQAELTGFYGLSYFRMALRKYMTTVGLPIERLNRIDWSGADPVPTAASGDASAPSVSFDDDSTRSRLPAAAAVVLVALSAAGYLFYSSRPEWLPFQTPTISVAELPQATADAAPAPPAEELPGLAPSGTSTLAPEADLPPPPAEPVSVSAQETDAALEGIRVAVGSTTWVFARFEDNSTLERGIAGGASLDLERFPVYLAVGSADGVSLIVDGRRVPLTPYARNGQIRLSRQELATLRP